MTKTVVLLPLLLGSIASSSIVGQAPPDLIDAIRARDQALEVDDTERWERFTAPEFTAVDAAGRILTRAGHLEAIRRSQFARATSRPVLYIEGTPVTAAEARSTYRCDHEHVALFADGRAAIRRCFDDASWSLEVWGRSGAGWQAVALQTTTPAR